MTPSAATITIRNVDPAVKARLRLQAARKGHSMEEEARRLISAGVTAEESRESAKSLGDVMRELFGPTGGVELPPVERGPGREPPSFLP
jgi:antitoxin FitA